MPEKCTPLCASCAHNVIVRYLVIGKPVESRACERRIRSFPEAEVCRDFEREPGVD